MRQTVGNTLWGGKDGKVRTRALAVAAVVVLALGGPAIARAGSVPAELLQQAQANPEARFNVIVKTPGGGASPAAQAVSALTNGQRKSFNDAFRKAQKLQNRPTDLAKKAAGAAAAAQRAKGPDAQRAQATAQAAQDAAIAAQAGAVAAQMSMVQMQASASWSSAAQANASWSSAWWSSASWSSSAGALALLNNASQDTAGDG